MSNLFFFTECDKHAAFLKCNYTLLIVNMEQRKDFKQRKNILNILRFLYSKIFLYCIDAISVAVCFWTIFGLIYITFLKDSAEIFVYATIKYAGRLKWLHRIVKMGKPTKLKENVAPAVGMSNNSPAATCDAAAAAFEDSQVSFSGNVNSEIQLANRSPLVTATRLPMCSGSLSGSKKQRLSTSSPPTASIKQLRLSKSSSSASMQQLLLSKSSSSASMQQLLLSKSCPSASMQKLLLSKSSSSASMKQLLLSKSPPSPSMKQLLPTGYPTSSPVSSMSNQIITPRTLNFRTSINDTNLENVVLQSESDDQPDDAVFLTTDKSLRVKQDSPFRWRFNRIEISDSFRTKCNFFRSTNSAKMKCQNLATKVAEVLPTQMQDKETLIVENDSPEHIGCCRTFFHLLKSKFQVDPIPSCSMYYKRF